MFNRKNKTWCSDFHSTLNKIYLVLSFHASNRKTVANMAPISPTSQREKTQTKLSRATRIITTGNNKFMKLTNRFYISRVLRPRWMRYPVHFDVKFLTYRSIMNGAKNALFQVYWTAAYVKCAACLAWRNMHAVAVYGTLTARQRRLYSQVFWRSWA